MPRQIIRGDDPSPDRHGQVVNQQGADPATVAAAALARMVDEGRSGRVTFTTTHSVEIHQAPEFEVVDDQRRLRPAQRDFGDRRFAIGLAAALGIFAGSIVASSFLPDLLGVVAGLVAAGWLYDRLTP